MWEPDCHAYNVKIVLLGKGKNVIISVQTDLFCAFALKSKVS